MTSPSGLAPGSLLDGADRQAAARSLWDAWKVDGRSASIVQGISGVGKSERLIRPLVDLHRRNGGVAVHIDVPLEPTDVVLELAALVAEELADHDDATPGVALAQQGDLFGAVRELLAAGALVVLDEFQRLLDPAGAPVEPFAVKLAKILGRGLPGCLWLATNRAADPVWAQPHHLLGLSAPDIAAAERIALHALDPDSADARFPPARRREICLRLGANPRALTLLGALLPIYHLDELLGPAAEVPVAPAEARLVEGIERGLLRKAQEGLDADALDLLNHLAVVPGPAPRGLLRHLAGSEDGVRSALEPLRERYLVQARGANRYEAHPLVREVVTPQLRGAAVRWRAIHEAIGAWHATGLANAGGSTMTDASLALAISGARFHLGEVADPQALTSALRPAFGYIERTYSWSSPHPATPDQRDSRIVLLEAYAEHGSAPGVLFTLATLLQVRGGRDDLQRALELAELATVGQDFSDPWILLIRVTNQVLGPEVALVAARRAEDHVAPEKSLFSIYQWLGRCLTQLARPHDAVTTMLRGAERALGNTRLVESAILMAAGEDDQLFLRVKDWMDQQTGSIHSSVVDLYAILDLERQGRWRDAATRATRARASHPKYFALLIHATLCWLGAGEPREAQAVLDSYPNLLRIERDTTITWLVTLVHLANGDTAAARRMFGVFLAEEASRDPEGVRARLLHEWDNRTNYSGIANPAYLSPVLPPTVTGLPETVRRPLRDGPVLPVSVTRVPEKARQRVVLAVATEWSSTQGGLSTFNRRMCTALAAAGAQVFCQVLTASHDERADAADHGVQLLVPPTSGGQPDPAVLARKPQLPEGVVPDLVIGHSRVTGPAARALAEDHYPQAQRIHVVHMAPDEIEWLKEDRVDDAGQRAEERTIAEVELGRTAHRLAAVGPRLYKRFVTELDAYDRAETVVRLDPGFDAPPSPQRHPPRGSPWRVLVVGRTDDALLKGLDLAARAVGAAVRDRGDTVTPVDLIIRGALPGTSHDLRERIRAWSRLPALDVIVRPYSADGQRLSSDLRTASLALMPSRSEGFGLVGVEAIVAGTPVLVSAESGLGQLLREVLPPDDAQRFVVPMTGDDDKDAAAWGQAVSAVLRNRDAAFTSAAELGATMNRERTWAAVAGLLLEPAPVQA